MKNFIVFLLILLLSLPNQAKLANTFAQNEKQYGKTTSMESFPSKKGFTGYATYNIDKHWKLKAFFVDNIVRTEHLVPKGKKATGKLSRNEVREWAKKMFAPANRGSYIRKVMQHRVQGHFFNRGLIAYEYLIEGKATKGFKGVKVLFYEGNKTYNKINRKAYL